jgi:ADP-ribosylglycohydrolase
MWRRNAGCAFGSDGPGADARTVFELAADTAALTHGHPSGYLSAGMVASVVHLLIDDVSLAKPGASTVAALSIKAAISFGLFRDMRKHLRRSRRLWRWLQEEWIRIHS